MKRKMFTVGVALTVLAVGIALGQKEETKQTTGGKVIEIQKHVEALLAKQGSHFLTIEKKEKEELIQVAREETGGKAALKVLISYPFTESADKSLTQAGITIPAGWKQVEFESGTFVTYDVTGSDTKSIATFLDLIFTKLFKWQPDSFGIEKM